MRRIVIAIGSTLTGLVLLFSWPTSLNKTVAAAADTSTGTATTTDSSTSTGTSTDTTTPTETATPTPEATAEPVTATYTGASVSTRYGDVQVQVTVTDGVVTAADAIAYPTRDRESQQINAWAVPALNDEVLAAQSASIDMLSHATVTSQAYIASLQDALDQAGI
ncbi:FMN-binding protein [Actinotalea sp.]|uniref:FMN-binding protein n=1 Tax=Actinotalea sp. TaxID=1872145 RepID=UPI002CE0C3DF|nr:FMN-binding protein [Actinotalea sp.]HQY34005.1 FMN-binding protein [Actinotalea sp.]HRA50199.1 FMN-binding protein [Actinotalea sp.]